jgi:hypothetical protein
MLGRATRRGEEYAWPLHYIPDVIEAARRAGLLSLGGQLQVRVPDGSTCECYWIDVDASKHAGPEMPWPVRVDAAADAATRLFSALPNEAELLAEARKAFPGVIEAAEAAGHHASDLLCFVWDVLSEGKAIELWP